MFREITSQERDCLVVDMTPSKTDQGRWDCVIRVIRSGAEVGIYPLPNATPAELGEELERSSVLHGAPNAPLPVFFRKVEPQVLATIRGIAA